jgi:hypothetical protein
MTFPTHKQHVEQLLRRHRPLGEIEQQINRAPLCDEEKAALWLYAWSATYYSQSSELPDGGRVSLRSTALPPTSP